MHDGGDVDLHEIEMNIYHSSGRSSRLPGIDTEFFSWEGKVTRLCVARQYISQQVSPPKIENASFDKLT